MDSKTRHDITRFVYPDRCPYCMDLIEPYEIMCVNCFEEIVRKHKSIRFGVGGYRCMASFFYAGNVRRMIIRVKFMDMPQFIPQIAAVFASDIKEIYGKDAFDLITAVPMYPYDLKLRRYNQSALLAQELSKLLGIPYSDTLLKIKRTSKQHDLPYQMRAKNLSGAYKVIDPKLVNKKRILLIDDIVTSGYTLTNCCKTLARSKPKRLCCAVLAKVSSEITKEAII